MKTKKETYSILAIALIQLRVIAAIFIFLPTLAIGQQSNVSDTAGIAGVVGRLGIYPLSTDSSDYVVLCSNPRLSCAILIDSLRVIQDPMTAMERDSLGTTHVLTIVGMLHFLSGGLQFSAKSDYNFNGNVLDEDRRDWLDWDQDDRLLFLAFWLSREQLFIAPEDAQAKIIKQWRNWYKKLPSDHVFKPLQGVDFFYWVWAWGD